MKTKLILIGLAAFVVEGILFEAWIYLSKPTPDVSITLVVIIPLKLVQTFWFIDDKS